MRWPAALLTIILLCICPGCGSKPSERPPETEKPVEDGKPAVEAKPAVVHRPRVPPHGCHHTKALLLYYRGRGMRVIISTSNLHSSNCNFFNI